MGEIKLMVYSKKPHVVALSETWLINCMPKFVGYECSWQNRVGFAGGLGFLIRRGVMTTPLNIKAYDNGYLEYQAIKLRLENGSYINILHIYNPNKPVTELELKHYVNQLDRNFVFFRRF